MIPVKFICFVAGAASVAAFAPLGAYPLALLTFAWLVHALHDAPPPRAFMHGFWFGLGFFGAGVSWVYVSMHDIGGIPAPVAAFATAMFCAFLALFPAAAAWLQARIPARAAVRACLLIPAAWVLFEWLRSWIMSGFPWISLGYAAAGWPLQGYAPLGGVFALSFLTVALAGMVWHIARTRRLYFVGALLVIVLGGEALRHVAWSTAQGAPLSVALLQGNIEQSLKFDPARYQRTLDSYARLAEASRARLIVFPETAIPRFVDAVDPAYMRRLDAIGKRNEGDLLVGVLLRRGPEEYYNSVISLGRSPVQVYDKVHLVPFGEFVPPGFDWALRTVNIPMSDMASGRARKPLAVAGERAAINICYEDAFGAEIAEQLPEATLLVNVSNVAWFGDSLAPAQHLQIARLRAIETARMHLTATNTGITAAIDADGRVLARLPQFTEDRLEVTAQGRGGATPYVRWRDWPIILLCVGVLIALTLRARRSR